MKSKIDRFLRHPWTEASLIVLILVWVALLVVEIGLDRDGLANTGVHLAGDAITAIFALELLARFHVAQKKARFFRYYWVDVISVLPMLHPLRFLRVIRLLRLHRVGILLHRRLLARNAAVATGFGMQLMIVLTIGIIVLVGGMAMYKVEGGRTEGHFATLGDAVWWSFFTLVSLQPTLGEPNTEMGKVIMAFVVVGGLATVAVFTGVMSAVMVHRLKAGLEVVDMELDELREHVVICGWNRAAHLILEELQADGAGHARAVVVLAELDGLPEGELKKVDRTRVFLQQGEYTSMDALESVGIRNASYAILLADKCRPRSDQDRDARTVLAALTIEKLNPEIFTCAQLLDRKNSSQLQAAGVENIVIDDEVSGTLIATSIRNRGLTGVITELLDVKFGNNLYKVEAPKAWAGRAVGEIFSALKAQHDALLVGIERHKEGRRAQDQLQIETLVNPPGDQLIRENDNLVLIARHCPKLG